MPLGQVLSQSISRNESYVAPARRSSETLSKNLNRLISAAVVSPRFRHLLFSDPIAALAAGYNGESFQLTSTEYAAVTSLHVSTVRDFAAQLLHMLQFASGDAPLYASEAQAEPFGRHNLTKSHMGASDSYRNALSAQKYGV